jgi:uncharacterized protein YbjT (DUF2867 family)
MKAILFGATGMVGQSVLRECLLDPDVEQVISVGRSSTAQRHAKLRNLVLPDLFQLSPIAGELSGFDACFFCLGVTSAGMSEEAYRRITVDLTISVAQMLVRLNPAMTFVFVSGAGADSTETSRTMWARVKGAAEYALFRMNFKACYAIRPAVILPENGIRSRTRLYQAFYTLFRPLYPVLRTLSPRYITTTGKLGRAMLRLARQGAPKPVIESWDIAALAD